MNWQAELELAKGAASAAADLLVGSFSANADIRSQAGKDIKTRADVEAEACILRHLAVSGVRVLAEESAGEASPSEGLCWMVDPLDGTMNFSRGFPMHAVSIGLWDGMMPILGVIYDLSRGHIYAGRVGGGAWRNNVPMHVSATAECGQGILATGFPTGRDYGGEALGAFVGRIQSFKKIRMIGSAAMSLAMVAGGIFDAYIEEDIMIWDVAAGMALVAAAGGRIEVLPSGKRHAVRATATNGLISV